jgi:two-component system, NarL family, response regulator LiaR
MGNKNNTRQDSRNNNSILITPCEYSILEILSKGKTYKEISCQKNVCIDTVKKHCTNMYKKLQVNNKTEAINWYLDNI